MLEVFLLLSGLRIIGQDGLSRKKKATSMLNILNRFFLQHNSFMGFVNDTNMLTILTGKSFGKRFINLKAILVAAAAMYFPSRPISSMDTKLSPRRESHPIHIHGYVCSHLDPLQTCHSLPLMTPSPHQYLHLTVESHQTQIHA